MVKLHVNKSIHETDTDRKSVSLSYGMVNFYFGVVHIYMGSSSVAVLIGSHSLCNSFVVNQFLYFTPNG